MGYIDVINEFIKEIIIEREEDFLIEWEKNDFIQDDIPYISVSMNKIDEDELHFYLFNDNNNNYDNLINNCGKPTLTEYHNILIELDNEYSLETFKINEKSYENMMEIYICMIAFRIISEYNEDKKNNVLEEIKKRKKAILTIQRAFRKYRYNPKYKYCKLIETQNLLNINAIDEKEFNNYIKKENIKEYKIK
jgi:hypothetical protein